MEQFCFFAWTSLSQGLVLEPLPFVICINNLDINVGGTINMFEADMNIGC